MAELVNLRLARKRRDRAERERLADVNRARHGMSKRERDGIDATVERERRTLDGAKRESPDT